jgi:hypothetical protein
MVHGRYVDKFSHLKGNAGYNAIATVRVNGKATGTFLASTVPSGPGYATIKDGTYSGTLSYHQGQPAILINGGHGVPVVGGRDPATGKTEATGIFVHMAGVPNAAHPLGNTGMGLSFTGKTVPMSAGCQLVCSYQYRAFLQAAGLIPVAGPPQGQFTVTVDTTENQ